MKQESDKYLRNEFTRLTRLKAEVENSLKLVIDEINFRKSNKRELGDVWKNSSGWFAKTELGISGPWKTEKAAIYASESLFKMANKADISSGL